jgi:hypothetical protein
MYKCGTTIETEVKIDAKNLPDKPSPRKPKHRNEWKISETQ